MAQQAIPTRPALVTRPLNVAPRPTFWYVHLTTLSEALRFILTIYRVEPLLSAAQP